MKKHLYFQGAYSLFQGLYYTMRNGTKFLEDSVYVILSYSGFAAQTYN